MPPVVAMPIVKKANKSRIGVGRSTIPFSTRIPIRYTKDIRQKCM